MRRWKRRRWLDRDTLFRLIASNDQPYYPPYIRKFGPVAVQARYWT